MADTPDFEAIADTLAAGFGYPRASSGNGGIVSRNIAEQLRLIWNARGAADIAKIKERDRLDLDSEEICAEAINQLDR